MQRSSLALTSLIKVFTCATLALGAFTQAQAADKKADPTGTWTWSTPGRNGGPERKSTLKLKLDGDKVTGTMVAARQGGTDTEISDGKVKGDEVSFTVT